MRRQQEQVSKLMIFSLVVMIAGFIMATPLSLILTIPAYILADKVSYMYMIQTPLLYVYSKSLITLTVGHNSKDR